MTDEEKAELEYELKMVKKLLDFYLTEGSKLSMSREELKQNQEDLLDMVVDIMKKLGKL